MNTRALQCFIKVYEKKSITAAAKEVFISPQGLSKIIKQLETELETDLFFRGTQGMEATESGEILFARARHLCYLMDDIKKEISIINGNRDSLNVIVSYSASFAYTIDAIYAFGEKYPDIQLKIKEYPDTAPLEELFQEQADVGIVLGRRNFANCDSELLHSGEAVLVVSNQHTLAGSKEVSLAELENELVVVKTLGHDSEGDFTSKCLELGISPVIKHESDNLTSIHHLCSSKNFVGLSIDYLEKIFINEDLEVVKIRENIPRNLYFVSRQRDGRNKAVYLFYNYLKDLKVAGQ